MKHFTIVFFYFCLFIICFFPLINTQGQVLIRQSKPVPSDFCISPAEQKLYDLVNVYRKKLKLSPLPLSKSLCFVASLHVKDLFLHHPDQGDCNSYSWSDQGPWKPFCYPKDENKKNSVWDKPRELTTYPGKGFEIVYWENNPVDVDTVIKVWQMEPYFNNFLTNKGKWLGKKWNAIGVGLYENYAIAWFGEVPDAEGSPIVCGTREPVILKDTIKKPIQTINDTTALRPASYDIIIRTNLTRKAADQLTVTLLTSGYPLAKVLEKDGKCRISLFTSQDKKEVQNHLKEIKKKYKDAWILNH